jgi:hypothetical protein
MVPTPPLNFFTTQKGACNDTRLKPSQYHLWLALRLVQQSAG